MLFWMVAVAAGSTVIPASVAQPLPIGPLTVLVSTVASPWSRMMPWKRFWESVLPMMVVPWAKL